MIAGTVNARHEAVLRLRLRGPGGAETLTDAIIDTGFSGSLTLPAGVVSALGLTVQSQSRAFLAYGTERQFDMYGAEVEWDGGWRAILVSAIGTDVLAGMRLLAGHELRVAVVPGGSVSVAKLP